MDFSLNDEQTTRREAIIRFAETALNDHIGERDSRRQFPEALWRLCGEEGVQGLPVPETYGGQGLDALDTALALEALAYGCRDGGLVFSLAAHVLACVAPVWEFGSEAQRRRLLPELCNGRLIAAHAMTEAESGSDAFRMNARAEPDGNGFRLSGKKTFVSNGPVADLILVYAATDPEKGWMGGITAFLVEAGAPGLTLGPALEKVGLHTCPMGEVDFEGVYVTKDAVLGRIGGAAQMFMRAMDWERTGMAACHVGTMQRLLGQAVEYARSRRAFEQPIGDFQAVSHRIADIKIRLEATRWLAYHAAWRLGRARNTTAEVSLAKVFASEALVEAANATVRILGGYGFLETFEAGRVLRDAVGSTLYSGTNDIHRNIIAGWLGLSSSAQSST